MRQLSLTFAVVFCLVSSFSCNSMMRQRLPDHRQDHRENDRQDHRQDHRHNEDNMQHHQQQQHQQQQHQQQGNNQGPQSITINASDFPAFVHALVNALNESHMLDFLNNTNGALTFNATGIVENQTAYFTLFPQHKTRLFSLGGNTTQNCPFMNMISTYLQNSTLTSTLTTALTNTGYSKYIVNNNGTQQIDYAALLQDPTAVRSLISYFISNGIVPQNGQVVLQNPTNFNSLLPFRSPFANIKIPFL